MFRGAAIGWRRFTSEFASGGPIDALTSYQRSVLFIPATNDHNEGALGSLRLFLRLNPCSTTVAFNASQRMRKNGTEKFIDKVITPSLETWVIRNGRTIFAKQQVGEFRERVAADYREKADTHDQQAAKKVAIEKERLERLAAVGMVTDVAAVEAMTLAKLREQLEIHKDILKDPVLTDKKQFKWGMVKSLIPRRMAVLAALERYHLANPGALKAAEKSVLLPSPMEVDGEHSSIDSEADVDSEDDMADEEFF